MTEICDTWINLHSKKKFKFRLLGSLLSKDSVHHPPNSCALPFRIQLARVLVDRNLDLELEGRRKDSKTLLPKDAIRKSFDLLIDQLFFLCNGKDKFWKAFAPQNSERDAEFNVLTLINANRECTAGRVLNLKKKFRSSSINQTAIGKISLRLIELLM